MRKEKQEDNNRTKPLYRNDEEYHGKRFHYDGWRVEDEGKIVIIKVTANDNTKGDLFLPWEEINKIRQFGWKQQEDIAKKKMRGKRIHCQHLWSIHPFNPECCQIGLDNGPHNVNCLDCQYIDGYIEEYDPDAEIKQAKIDWKNVKIIDIK